MQPEIISRHANTAAPTRKFWLDFERVKARGLINSRSTAFRMIRDGLFPAPIKLSKSRNGRLLWYLPDIERWEAERLAERTARPPKSLSTSGPESKSGLTEAFDADPQVSTRAVLADAHKAERRQGTAERLVAGEAHHV